MNGAAMTTPAGTQTTQPTVDEVAALSTAACLFRSLGDPMRLAIIRHLMLGPHRVVDLTRHLDGPAQSSVSAALACLRDCGLAESQPQGRASLWSLSTQPELLELLAAAEKLLSATGDQVTLCPVYGTKASS
jgi:DNA-binding transcriptional ArsR family regulator